MANIRLAHDGYAVLELNALVARRTGQLEAQCKLDDTDFGTNPAESGMLLKVDSKARKVLLPDAATDKVLLHYSTEHLYDEREVSLKDWCLKPGSFYPRLAYLNKGDKFTTNCVTYDASVWSTVSALCTSINASSGHVYGLPHTDGTILLSTASTNAVVEAIAAPKMPDGQQGVKFLAL